MGKIDFIVLLIIDYRLKMGYESEDCVCCYCNYTGHNISSDDNTYHNICRQCFLKICPRGLQDRTCADYYVSVAVNAICDFCEQKDICLYHVAVCKFCTDQMNPDNHEFKTHAHEHVSNDLHEHFMVDQYTS
jgi:hypothetical protein|uniref:Uncharacterized protein n=1 Tax=viral metagenome TaxID=1070528 RepID=A0A6C0BKE2_9ZZZZ